MSKKLLDKQGVTELITDIANKISDKYATKDSISTTTLNINDMPLIGTSENCTYRTILDWANHQAENNVKVAYACTSSQDGCPSDSPFYSYSSYDTFLEVRTDYYNNNQVVILHRFIPNNPSVIEYRCIKNRSWADSGWKNY